MGIDDLTDVARARGIRRIAYFHCDHFEPWGNGVSATSLRAVERFNQMTRRSPYGARLSLFYSTCNGYNLDDGGGTPSGESAPGDKVFFSNFTHRSPADNSSIVQSIRPLVTDLGHEMHLHVHHEWWTKNELNVDSPIWKWVQANSNAEMDERRLALFVKFATQTIAYEIGRAFDRWGFVHGNWALNAADREICLIESEIDLLMQAGGFGDFTFPAGRRHCDPIGLEQPYTCLPVHGRKIYENPESQPRPVGFGTRAMTPDRFFIWNSPIKSERSSIDWYHAPNLKVFQDLDGLVRQWLEKSVCFGDTLFLKTHAHSLNHRYGLGTSDAPIPHAHPDIVRAFDHLMRVCDAGRIEFKPVTVNEVMHVLAAVDTAPAQDPGIVAQALASFRGAAPGPALAPAASLKAMARTMAAAPIPPVSALASSIQAEPGPLAALMLTGSEAALLRYVEQTFEPKAACIFISAAGAGTLAAKLAQVGYLVTAFEPEAGKCWALRHLAGEVTSSTSGLGGKLVAVQGGFPDAFKWRDFAKDRSNLLILSQAALAPEGVVLDHALRAAASFEHIIVDTRALGAMRQGAQLSLALEPHARLVQPVSGTNFAHFTTVARGTGAEGPVGNTAELVASVAERVKLARRALQEQPGAVDELYSDKLRRDAFLEPHELAVTRWLHENFDTRATQIIEIGSAQGGLSCLLSGLGFETVGFEMHQRRLALAQALVEELSRRESFRPPLLVDGAFPDAIDRRIVGHAKRTVVVATNIVCTYSGQNEERIIRGAVLFDDFVIDVGRFCIARNEASARRNLWCKLAARHFAPMELLFDQSPQEYWRFAVRPFSRLAAAHDDHAARLEAVLRSAR